MNINDIAISVNETIRWGLFGALAYGGSILALNAGGILLQPSEKIETREQLQEALKYECALLGLDTSKISIRHTTAEDSVLSGGFATKFGDDSYEIGVPRGSRITRVTLRHELAHIANNDFGRGKLHYFFVGEPRATLYSATGLRI